MWNVFDKKKTLKICCNMIFLSENASYVISIFEMSIFHKCFLKNIISKNLF